MSALLPPAVSSARTAMIGGSSTSATKPNIVLILTDDQRWDEIERMPTVQSELVGQGVTFTNGMVVNPLCCPSRATILTGKYSHGTDVYKNEPPHGGYSTFRTEEPSTVATWLHDDGYRTGLVGKYLNGYTPTEVANVPPGWDRWAALALPQEGADAEGGNGYYDYTLSVDGTAIRYGSSPSDYSTDVLSAYSREFIQTTPDTQPLFLYFAPRAPHAPHIPPPRYADACSDLAAYRPPNYFEADMSDKPLWVRDHLLPPTTPLDSARLQHCQSLLAVDDAVGEIVSSLRETQRLDNTLLVFASDNGLHFGEHTVTEMKKTPYEESIRVPMVARFDPLTAGRATTDEHLVLNLDFAPTFAAAAGISAPGADGASLLPLLAGEPTQWRSDMLIEALSESSTVGTHVGPGTTQPRVPTYCAVRGTQYKYVAYPDQEELYDVLADPYEVSNLVTEPAYASILEQQRARVRELCNPLPPEYSFPIAPTIIMNEAPPPTGMTSATFVFTATALEATFTCSLDGAPATSCSSGISYDGLALGRHRFVVRAIDGSGNAGTPLVRVWTVDPAPLSISQTVTGSDGFVDSPLAYDLTVSTGEGGAQNVTVADTLPRGAILDGVTASQGSCSGTTTVTCDIGVIDAASTATIHIDVRPIIPGRTVNRATVAPADATPANNVSSTTTTVAPRPAVRYVEVSDAGFRTSGVTPRLGESVQWNLLGPSDNAVNNDRGVFRATSPVAAPAYSSTGPFFAAGAYSFHDSFGHVVTARVRMAVSPSPSGTVVDTFTVAWATGQAPDGYLYDVQIRPPGGIWQRWRTRTTEPSATFNALDPAWAAMGRYDFRARLVGSEGYASGFSPVLLVTIS